MSMTTASDPSGWCFAELDHELGGEDLDRFLTEHDPADEVDEIGLPAGRSPEDPMASRTRLLEALEVLTATVGQTRGMVPSNRILGAVLEMWDLADGLDPAAAAPLELLLGHLIERHHAPADEVLSTLADVERALAGRLAA